MKLQINRSTKIKDLQKEFSTHYPYLKIQFYKKPHGEGELSSLRDRISPEQDISKVSKLRGTKSIDIRPNRTVADLEKAVHDKLGIGMQVSRRTGDIWIETSLTDGRTIGMQNEQGKMSTMSSEIILADHPHAG